METTGYLIEYLPDMDLWQETCLATGVIDGWSTAVVEGVSCGVEPGGHVLHAESVRAATKSERRLHKVRRWGFLADLGDLNEPIRRGDTLVLGKKRTWTALSRAAVGGLGQPIGRTDKAGVTLADC